MCKTTASGSFYRGISRVFVVYLWQLSEASAWAMWWGSSIMRALPLPASWCSVGVALFAKLRKLPGGRPLEPWVWGCWPWTLKGSAQAAPQINISLPTFLHNLQISKSPPNILFGTGSVWLSCLPAIQMAQHLSSPPVWLSRNQVWWCTPGIPALQG